MTSLKLWFFNSYRVSVILMLICRCCKNQILFPYMTCDIDDVAIDDLLVSIVCPTVREVCLNQSKMNVIFGYKIKHPIYCCTESSI